jgi:hypothetical protein
MGFFPVCVTFFTTDHDGQGRQWMHGIAVAPVEPQGVRDARRRLRPCTNGTALWLLPHGQSARGSGWRPAAGGDAGGIASEGVVRVLPDGGSARPSGKGVANGAL